jgi:hypothetical protein
VTQVPIYNAAAAVTATAGNWSTNLFNSYMSHVFLSTAPCIKQQHMFNQQ